MTNYAIKMTNYTVEIIDKGLKRLNCGEMTGDFN